MDPIEKETLHQAISNLVERYGDQLPDPEHYPRMVKAMVTHEVYEIERKRYESI
jgi:hypothetical protein